MLRRGLATRTGLKTFSGTRCGWGMHSVTIKGLCILGLGVDLGRGETGLVSFVFSVAEFSIVLTQRNSTRAGRRATSCSRKTIG